MSDIGTPCFWGEEPFTGYGDTAFWGWTVPPRVYLPLQPLTCKPMLAGLKVTAYPLTLTCKVVRTGGN